MNPTAVEKASVRLILVAHAPLASALRSVALHLFEDCHAQLAAVDVASDWTGDQALRAIEDALGDASEALLLVDAKGATPCNAATRMQAKNGLRIATVYGVNVPMLWRTLSSPHESLQQLQRRALEGGSVGIGRLDSEA